MSNLFDPSKEEQPNKFAFLIQESSALYQCSDIARHIKAIIDETISFLQSSVIDCDWGDQ